MKKRYYLIIGTIVILILFIYNDSINTFDVYDDGIITNKFIKKNNFLFYSWDTYHFELDSMHKAKRTIEVEKDVYVTMNEGYIYRYYIFSHSGNLTR